MPTIRVALTDDQAMVRAGFRRLLELEADLDVVGEAADGLEAVALAARTQPDVMLLDIRMPRLDGIAATRRITENGPTRAVTLTTFDLDEYVYGALRAGASGFLLKDAEPEEMLAAVRAAAGGDAVISPRITRRLLAEFVQRPTADDADQALDNLTDREREIFSPLARGRSNTEIAATLFLGEATVKTHVGNVLAKLQLRDRIQAVVYAYEHGIVTPGG
jgi:DNA-binding NarL/FixJ family response regulator